MSSPTDGPPGPAHGSAATSPDQTIGYESMRSSDVASEAKADTHATPEPGRGQTPRSVFGNRTHGGRPTGLDSFGKSLLTATGAKVAPESLVGPYEVMDELGTGGMGVVYKARHIHLNRTVALKMIIGGLNVGEENLNRFRLEAEVVAKLNHPNIVQVYDVGDHNGVPYIALELVEGGNLSAKCEGKPQKHHYAAQTAETLARAVHVAHEAGVVHRDLKPQNVLMTLDGQPKVTDFGLAKDIGGGGSGQTHAGSIIGTPSYMAPEQAAGRIHDIGPATDVYALGCILYEMLVGHPPFRGESPIATIRLVLDGEAVSPKALQPHTPRDLDTICMKALQKPPHRRYATAADFAEDLRRHLDGEPIKARPVSWAEWGWKWVKRNKIWATAIAIFHVFLVIFVAFAIWSYIQITNRAQEAEQAHRSAKKNLDESTRRMIRLNVANGTRLLDTYDYLGAPLWFAEALRLESEKLGEEPGFAERERMHRIRLRAVFDHCPRLSQVWLHEVALTDGRYDPTGRYAVTASEDGIARVWDTRDGLPVSAPMEHGAAVRAVAIAADARTVATGGADGFIRIWSVRDSQLLHVLNNGAAITRMQFAPDGTVLWSGCAAGRMRGWDVAGGREKLLFNFADRVTDLAISENGLRVAACSRDGTARVLDAATGLPVTPPLKHAAGVTGIAFSPDGRRAATGSLDRTLAIWDTTTGQPVYAPIKHPAAVHAVAICPDGKRVVSGCEDSTARVWDLETGQAVGRPVSHDGPVIFAATGPDGRWAATASEDNTVRVWDMTTGELVTPPLRNNALASAVRFSPNGHEILVADQTRVVRVWNLIGNGDLSGTTTVQKAAVPLAAAGRDDMQTVAGRNGELSVTFGGGQAVRVRRSSDHEPLTPPLRSGAAISAAEFSPDATVLVTGDLDGGVMAWSTADGKPLWTTPAKHASKVLRAVFNPAGTAIITTSDDNTARIWNAADGAPIIPPIRLGAGVSVVEFGPDGKLFYTELANGRGRIWDANTGEPLTPPFPIRKDWLASLIVAKWSVEEMLAGGRMLSGQQLTEAGDVLPTDAVSLREDWLLLKSRYEIVASTPPAALTAWRGRQVKACLLAEQWYGAGWHLDRLIAATPDNPDFRRERAGVSAKLGDWKHAAEGAKNAILLQPANADNWYQRGVALGQLGDWRDAAAHINHAMLLRANPEAALGLLAKVRLEAGDFPGYRTACRELVDRYRESTDPAEARAVAWVVSLSPESGIDPGTLVKLAEAGTKTRSTDPDSIAVLALAHLRSGRAEESIAALKGICDGTDVRPTAWLIYSLALASSGPTESAKAWRDKAAKWLADQNPPNGGVPPTWSLRTDIEILLREASTMK